MGGVPLRGAGHHKQGRRRPGAALGPIAAAGRALCDEPPRFAAGRRPPAAAIIGAPAPPTDRVNRNLLLLAFCQALLLTNNVTFIAINGLVGLQLAPWGWMATLPVTGYVVGAALSAMPVARLQARLGRQRSFQIGLVVAAASAASCALAVSQGSFWLLVASTVVAGVYSANGQLYRVAGI